VALREIDPNRVASVAAVPTASLEALKAAVKQLQPAHEVHAQDYDDSSDDEEHFIFNCDEVRNKINALLRSGEYKVTQFQKELGINSNSYGRFMSYKGSYAGSDNQTYELAHRFFRKRQERGIKTSAPKTAPAKDLQQFDVSGVVIPGEEDEAVAVFDDCNEVRRKINAHLKEPGVTQASFCREIAKSFPVDDKKIQSTQLSAFLKKKGEASGAESSV
jgi:hypothetical protein